MRTALRVAGMTVGIVGAVIGLIVNILYSLAHTLGRVAGISNDKGHFFIGLGLTAMAFIGAFMATRSPVASAVLLVLATIGFCVIVGWWAILIAPFLLVAAILVFMDRPKTQQPALT